jgi:hypothetical protein
MTGLRLPPWVNRRTMSCAVGAVGVWLTGPAGPAWSQPASAAQGGIHTCVTADGRRLTADRYIDECRSREQRILNRDGSLRAVIPPTLTAEEAAEAEARARAAAIERAARADAVRRDRNLLARYPNEAAHQRARVAAADTVRAAIRTTELRLRDLAAERKPLANEAEFYVGKPLPAKLKGQLDANDAALEAQRSSALNQQAELDRINRLYDAELERLRRLWAGAPPGSLGALPALAPVSRPAAVPAALSPSAAQAAPR